MYLFPFDNGAMPAIAMAGVLVSGIFLNENLRKTPKRQLLLGFAFAGVSFVLGLLLRPLGISKIRATPTWALWSIAAATTVFAVFYYVADLRGRTDWAFLFRAPGANTLLTYLLPDLTYYLLAFLNLSILFSHWNAGFPGVIRSLCFTLIMLLLSLGLTRAKLRVQL